MDLIQSRALSTTVLATLAEFAALPGPPQNVVAWCEETDAPYEFVPGDVTAVDGWTSIAPTGGTAGRWLLRSDKISIAPLGGVLDDTARLQSAINALAGKAKLALRIGIFRTTATLTFNVTNQPFILEGFGPSDQANGAPAASLSVLTWFGAASLPMVDISSGETQVTIRGVTFNNAIAGVNAASHAIRAIDSNQLVLENVVIFPATGFEFTTAGVELGGAAPHDLSKAHLINVYIRNCVVGLYVKSVIQFTGFGLELIECATCMLIGSATTTAYSVHCFGSTYEPRNGQTGVRIVRGVTVGFAGCQFDAWQAGNYGFEILSTAALADTISLVNCRFTGNTVANGIKFDFGSATINVENCFFSGFTGAGILNSNNLVLNIIGCHSDDNNIPIVNSITTGNVRMVGNHVAAAGVQGDLLGNGSKLAIPTYTEFGGGTQPTTGLLRFPKPSEQGTLAVFRREASAVDVPFIRTDVGSNLKIGETDVGVLPTVSIESNVDMYLRTGTVYLREAGGTIRSTLAIAAGSTWDLAAGTSLAFKYNATVRMTLDSTGIGFYTHATVAQQVLATGAGATVDNVITALQNLGLVKQV